MKRLLLLFALALTICSTAMAQDGPANNEIWYTSTDGNIVVPWAWNLIHDDIYTSNTYKDGKGVLTFPSEITNVRSQGQYEEYAHYGGFSECRTLESVTFPSTVSGIGHAAFSYCDNLVYIKFLNKVAFGWPGYLEKCSENIGKTYILVPEEAVDDYKQAGWTNVYSSSLSGNELQALKEELKKEISEALKPFLPLSDDDNAEIETLMTNMKNAADIESALNVRYHQFRPAFKEIKYRHTSIYHPVSEPTYTTVGYTQECWEDPETGKLYAEAECTNELNTARVVTYKKLRKNPVVSENHTVSASTEKGSCIYNWAVEYNWEWVYDRKGTNSTSFEFKVYGEDVANARIKWWQLLARNETMFGYVTGITAIKIFINNNLVHETTSEDINGGHAPKYENWYDFPLSNLQHGDVVRVELNQQCMEFYFSYFLASLEYTSTNGGDPDVIAIKTDDKRKFKGVDDPELTYNIHYPTSSTEELTDISVSRTLGENTGIYPIHVSYAVPANPDCEILNNDGKLEIVDGVYHSQGETRSDGLIYLQDCWEETATGKFYADGYLEHELKPESVIGYPKLSFSPVTSTDGFSIKESATYDGVPFDWAAETQYSSHTNTGTRFVEFTVLDFGISNASLKWYIDHGEVGYGPFTITILVNDNPVENYTQTNGESLTGFHTVALPELKHGDVVKFEVQKPSVAKWAGAPVIAACLQYITPQDLFLKAQEAGSTVELKRNGATEPVKIQYSTDYSNWTTVDFSSATTTGIITLANVGDRVYFRKADEGVAKGFSNANHQFSFAMTGKIAASGNVMSLIDNTCEATTIPNEYCFAKLFEGCTSLTAAPALPATELKASCYENMFSGCTNLKSAPTLSAMKMLDYCYSNMFKDCTSLTTAPSLPATTLAFNCYMGMFSGCTKLESAPELPATGMYRECYKDMFKDCTSLTTAPELPATAMIYHCYYGMFSGCTKLNHVKVAFTEWTDGSTYIPENWLDGVASTGTFVCPDALDKTQTGASYIPEGWTPVFEVKANQDPDNKTNYYATFYSKENTYEVPEGVTAYTGAVEESASNPDESVLNLTPVADDIIPANEAVILKATQSQVYLPYTTEKANKSDDNKLEGTDEETTLRANQYALSLGQYGVGFYLWEGKSIGANKAYLTLSDGQRAPLRSIGMIFDDGTVTGIPATIIDQPQDDIIYNLQGQRVDESYKGLIIKNGQKVYNY